jgi:hypothetical protein
MAITIKQKPFKNSFSRNIMPVVANSDAGAGTKLKIELNYRKINSGGGFTPLYAETLDIAANGDVVFYIQNELDSLLKWFVPKWGGGIVVATSCSMQYIIKITEYDASNTQLSYLVPIQSSDNYFVYKGGVALEQFMGNKFFNFMNTSPGSDDTQRFWTWLKNDYILGLYQPNWLLFQVQAAAGYNTSSLFVKCYYTDGSDATFSQNIALFTTVVAGQLVSIPVGFNQLKAIITTSPPTEYNGSGSRLMKYEVWVEDTTQAAQIITERQSFTIDWAWAKRSRYFIFNNSLGGVDCIGLFFQEQNGAEFDIKMSSRPLKYDYFTGGQLPALNFANNISEQFFRKANSGDLLRKSDLDAMRQLSLAEVVFEIVPASELVKLVRFLPINSTSKKIAYFKKLPNSPIYQLELEYQYAFTNNSYTPEDLSCSSAVLANYFTNTRVLPTPGFYGFYGVRWESGSLVRKINNPIGTINLTLTDLVIWLNANWGDIGTWAVVGSDLVNVGPYQTTIFTINTW